MAGNPINVYVAYAREDEKTPDRTGQPPQQSQAQWRYCQLG